MVRVRVILLDIKHDICQRRQDYWTAYNMNMIIILPMSLNETQPQSNLINEQSHNSQTK